MDKKYIKYLCFTMFLLSFMLLRPHHMQHTGLMYSGDDESYFAHASSLAFFEFPSYKNEIPFQGNGMPMHSIGPGIMAAPFVWVFSLIDRVEGSPVVKKRESNDARSSWALFGFFIATYFYFWMACFLLYKGLRYYFNSQTAYFSVLCLFLLETVPLYVFRRPIFSHIYELFLLAVIVYFILKDAKTKFLDKPSVFMIAVIGIICGLISLVRYNNVLFTLAAPIVIFCFRKGKFEYKEKIKELIGVYLISLFVIFIFKILPTFLYGEAYFHAVNGEDFLKLHSLVFFIKRAFYIFFWPDWGLIYTVPFMIIGFYALFAAKYENKKQLLYLSLPLLVNFYVESIILIPGGWYGYRYVIFSLLPIVTFPFAFYLNQMLIKYGGRKVFLIFGLLALISMFSVLCFEGNATNLNLNTEYLIKAGKASLWSGGNSFYQLEVWKTLFFHPTEFFVAIFKGGFLYLIYVFSFLFGYYGKLPMIVFEKYPLFRPDILVKVIAAYIFPFFMYFVFKKNIVSIGQQAK